MSEPFSIYFVVGEASGDALGADLIEHLKAMGVDVVPLGLGGPKMQAHGLEPVFDPSELAIMGVSGVIIKLPSLLARARQIANDVIAKNPDVLLLIDSPEFAKVVARNVKKRNPGQKVVKYVSPTVWSWRPGRAPRMRSYVDHVLAILPFEPAVMAELGGPATTYVGHPLSRLAGKIDLSRRYKPSDKPIILLMPGSRRSEVSRLLPIMGATVETLDERGTKARYVLPAVDHLQAEIRETTMKWATPPKIIEGEGAKIEAMKSADAAIAASGTAILELALYGVPTVSIYKPDPALNAIRFLIKAWTAALPNLIADKVIVPERINEFARPGYIARLIEALIVEGHERSAQISGFEEVHRRIAVDVPPGRKSAEIILELTGRRLAKTGKPSTKS